MHVRFIHYISINLWQIITILLLLLQKPVFKTPIKAATATALFTWSLFSVMSPFKWPDYFSVFPKLGSNNISSFGAALICSYFLSLTCTLYLLYTTSMSHNLPRLAFHFTYIIVTMSPVITEFAIILNEGFAIYQCVMAQQLKNTVLKYFSDINVSFCNLNEAPSTLLLFCVLFFKSCILFIILLLPSPIIRILPKLPSLLIKLRKIQAS